MGAVWCTRGAASGHEGVRHAATQGAQRGVGLRRSLRLRKGAVVAQGVLRGTEPEQSAGLRWAAAWGCAWEQRVVAQGRSMRPRMGATWNCAWAQHSVAMEHSMRLRRGAARLR